MRADTRCWYSVSVARRVDPTSGCSMREKGSAEGGDPGDTRRAMSRENMEIAREFYAAFNRRDLSYMLACLTEDCEILPPAYAVDGVVYSGHEGFVAWFEGLSETWSSVRLTPTLRDAGERYVIAELAAELVGRESGTPVDQTFWTVSTFENGKFARSEAFASEALALEAVGLRE